MWLVDVFATYLYALKFIAIALAILILLALLFTPAVGVLALGLGLGDTWVDWRGRARQQLT